MSCTFVIRFKKYTEQHLVSLRITLKYLLQLNLKVILLEAEENNYYRIIEDIETLDKLQYFYTDKFHRTKITNTIVANITTPYIVLYDPNIIIERDALLEAEKLLSSNDIVFPFDKIKSLDNDKLDHLENVEGVATLQSGNLCKYCIFIKKDIYVRNGGENEDLEGTSYDDDERYYRFLKLGYKINRISSTLLYLGNWDGSESRFLGNYNTKDRDYFIKLKDLSPEKYKYYCLFYGKLYYPGYLYNNYLIPHLVGGLGNRLFQIASIYGLSKKLGKNFSLDINQKDPNVHSSLNYFDTIFKNIPKTSILEYKLYNEPIEKYSMYSDIKLDSGNYVMHGYYQNEKYFKDYKVEIFQLFDFTNFDQKKYDNLDNSMFIHLRYFPPEDGGNLHDINMTVYLKNVIGHLGEKINNIHFYILSNNIKATLQRYNLLKFQNKTIVNDCNELEALYLMSRCELGGICSNSSLGWWGAYLNTNPKKTIFFPKKYLKNTWECDIWTEDMVVLPV